MNAWEGLGTALVAGLVSVAVSLVIRFWDSHKVEWLLVGEAHDEYAGGRPTGKLRVTAEFHNVGDGDAFGVISRRSNGDKFEPFEVFERGKVASGESVEVVMSVDPDHWDQIWVELRWESSPTGRSKTSRTGERRLHESLWRVRGGPPTTPEFRRRMRPGRESP